MIDTVLRQSSGRAQRNTFVPDIEKEEENKLQMEKKPKKRKKENNQGFYTAYVGSSGRAEQEEEEGISCRCTFPPSTYSIFFVMTTNLHCEVCII